VAKEYCAARVDGDGVLVLSEFAGAAAQLQHGAILVNPWDTAGTAGALARALDMPRAERRARMRKLRRSVRKYDIHHWVDSFLDAAFSRNLDGFPKVEEFVPVMEHAGAVPAH
jgi:trehalose 6-phosphate synthase/phosphatase